MRQSRRSTSIAPLFLALMLVGGCTGILSDDPKFWNAVIDGLVEQGKFAAGAVGYRSRTNEWPVRAVDITESDFSRAGLEPLKNPRWLDEQFELRADGDTLWVLPRGDGIRWAVVQGPSGGDWRIRMGDAP